MLRWIVVCALLAQTLALARPNRHASWPNWMKMPSVDWPDWMRMPTQDDLPDVTIPDIDLPQLPKLPSQVDIPDVQIPEINMQMPDADAFGGMWNPFQRNGEQRAQTNNGNVRGQGNGRWGQQNQGTQSPSSNGDERWSWWPSQDRNGDTNGRRPDSDRQPTRHEPQRGSSYRRGPRPETPQTNRERPSQTYSRGTGNSNRGRPDGDRQPTWQNVQQGSSNGRGQRQKPRKSSQTGPSQERRARPEMREGPPQRQELIFQGEFQRPGQLPYEDRVASVDQEAQEYVTKGRKQRPDTHERPPQRQQPVRTYQKSRRPSSRDHLATRPRTEPSVNQQVEDFHLGMPEWLRDELNDTFTSMQHEIDQGRLRMNSWADDITDSAQEWWDRWTGRGRGNTQSRRPSRPTTTPRDETPERQHPSYNRDRSHGRHGDRTRDRPGHQNNRGWGHEYSNGRGRTHSYGRGHTHSNGRGHAHSNGRGHEGGRKWYEGSGRYNTTTCKRPFRPMFEGPSREEPYYTVLCGGDDYEARLYNSSVWVSVTVRALTYDLAVHKAYIKLYRYINGHNSHGAEVTRTVPLHTKVKANSRDNRWFERHDYTISFYLPKDVHVNPPSPSDPELFIEHEGPTVYYAHAFRGYALEFNIWEYLDELTNTLDLSQEAYKPQDYIVNVYDAPWRFFNRRNDILVAMDTNILVTPSCTVPGTEAPTTTFTTQAATTTQKTPSTPRSPTTKAPTTRAPTTVVKTNAPTTRPTDTAPTTKPPTVQPTIFGEIPAEIKVPNPFENNDIEQEQGPKCKPGSECPRFKTAVPYDGFEQRHYAYSRWICMDQAACDFERAQEWTQGDQRTKGPLLEYFFPKGNRKQKKMELTTPLVIGMDVSDLNRTDCGKTYTSCLFIPEEHQGAPPIPRDARLYIQDIPAMSRYVHPFGGFATSQNVPKLGIEFLMKLEESQLPYDGSIVAVAQYTTSKLAKTRLNEIWVMDQSLLQGEISLE